MTLRRQHKPADALSRRGGDPDAGVQEKTITAILAGCSSLTPSSKMQSMSLYAIGVPGIAVITSSTQNADNAGDDENAPKQMNPVTVRPTIK